MRIWLIGLTALLLLSGCATSQLSTPAERPPDAGSTPAVVAPSSSAGTKTPLPSETGGSPTPPTAAVPKGVKQPPASSVSLADQMAARPLPKQAPSLRFRKPNREISLLRRDGLMVSVEKFADGAYLGAGTRCVVAPNGTLFGCFDEIHQRDTPDPLWWGERDGELWVHTF
jgi:hypothetical protein